MDPENSDDEFRNEFSEQSWEEFRINNYNEELKIRYGIINVDITTQSRNLSSVNIFLIVQMIKCFQEVYSKSGYTLGKFYSEIRYADRNLKEITEISNLLDMGKTIYCLRGSSFAFALYNIKRLLDIIKSYDENNLEEYDINHKGDNTLRDEILQLVSNVDYERLDAMTRDKRLPSPL